MNSTKASKRILALDILRGVTIAGMIMVNNPGSWGTYLCPLAACRVERSDPHRPRLSLLHVYHGNFHIHFPEEIQLRVQPRRRHEDTETHHRHFPYRHGYRLVLAFLLLLGLRSGQPQFRREAMGFRLDIRPYPYSGCHATAGPLLRSSLHHCTNHEA